MSKYKNKLPAISKAESLNLLLFKNNYFEENFFFNFFAKLLHVDNGLYPVFTVFLLSTRGKWVIEVVCTTKENIHWFHINLLKASERKVRQADMNC